MTPKRGRPNSNFVRAVLCSPNEKKRNRKQWSDESMVRALYTVKEGIPVNRAAELYCVPRSTCRDRVTGNIEQVYTKPGSSPYLTNVEETELVNFLLDVPKAGYGNSRGINNIYFSYYNHCLKIPCWNGSKLFSTQKYFLR